MKITDDINKRLMGPIPKGATFERAKGGTSLTYVDTAYVIGTLSEIFGPTGWNHEIIELSVVCSKAVKTKSGRDAFSVTYRCRSRIVVYTEDGPMMSKQDVGYGHGIDVDEGQAHESAGKEAVTDALKRAARLIGWATGLDLYRKDWADKPEPTADKSRPGVPVEATIASIAKALESGDVDKAYKSGVSYLKKYSGEDLQKLRDYMGGQPALVAEKARRKAGE